MTKFTSKNICETERIGEEIGKKLKGTEVIALYGGLGMGKTALTRGIAKGAGCRDCVSSPTFAIVNEYRGRFKIYHFDMYRIDGWDDLYSIGFFDYLENGVLIIEWSENIEAVLPEDCIRIKIQEGSTENSRIFTIEGEDFLESSCN
ncbi:MAG: tRNA (adenosine(37)-N6)-threonylcarbamoyltransferase complex ATPase subunit type 1 TsaE [Anaeromassilibacillus sp.]|nr:tRNA (adenosine(37)-N6)-threonylcarbamoyltransferase complex ATPase subunit type 1 TsaE [Anaeromassilibacillus sp.]MDY3779597.1 tRNA (adenosine(37)-N6)-threonylcarbamoyltransferase complex ATPase subunit type 1 TsaE [Candidatus Limousia pullorum]